MITEAITCGKHNRRHTHSDPCFEVRNVLATHDHSYDLSDLFEKSVSVPASDVDDAPEGLLARKTAFYGRLVKLIRDTEIRDQGSAHALLDMLLQQLDQYTFANEGTNRIWRKDDPGPLAARLAFDRAAGFLLEHRDDRGLGRQRHVILADVVAALNEGPVADVLGGKLALE